MPLQTYIFDPKEGSAVGQIVIDGACHDEQQASLDLDEVEELFGAK